MNLVWRNNFKPELDGVELDRIVQSMSYMNIGTGLAIDSYAVGLDGVKLNSIFIVSEDRYLLEVKLTGNDLEFDCASANRLLNFRIEFKQVPRVETAAGDGGMEIQGMSSQEVGARKYVVLTLVHVAGMASQLSYFGDDYEQWIAFVSKAFPKELLL